MKTLSNKAARRALKGRMIRRWPKYQEHRESPFGRMDLTEWTPRP